MSTTDNTPIPSTSVSTGKYVFFAALAILASQLIPSGSPVPTPQQTTPEPIDMFEALKRVRAAAKLQRAKLVAANRMPAETAISKLVAEAYEKYKSEDELLLGSGAGPRASVTPTAATYSRPASAASQPSAVPPVSRGTYRPPPIPKAATAPQQPQQPQPQQPQPQPQPQQQQQTKRAPPTHAGLGAMPKKFQNTEIPPSSQQSKTGEVDQGIMEIVRSVAQRHPQAIGVFLGVGRGKLAAETLRLWSNSPGLYLVDPFIRQLGAKDQRSDKEQQLDFEAAVATLKIFEGRHAMVRDLSFSFVKNMKEQNAQAALVLIDKNDRTDAIYKDLVDWWPVVGRGGVMAGRLYAEENKVAIDRFVKEKNLALKRSGDAWFLEKL